MATNNFKGVNTNPPQNSNPSPEKSSNRSNERDTALAQINNDKNSVFIKAWEEGDKSKVDKRANKKLSKVAAWENKKKANLGAKMKKLEERLEQKKAEYAEKIEKQRSFDHKMAEQKKAMVEVKRGEEILKTEDMANKYRTTRQTPNKKLLGCIG